jgi:hypothetical protein
MFELEPVETESLVSQNVTPSKSSLGGAKPFAFTEQGVATLSAVLRSEKAVEISLAIMRAFFLCVNLPYHINNFRKTRSAGIQLHSEIRRHSSGTEIPHSKNRRI